MRLGSSKRISIGRQSFACGSAAPSAESLWLSVCLKSICCEAAPGMCVSLSRVAAEYLWTSTNNKGPGPEERNVSVAHKWADTIKKGLGTISIPCLRHLRQMLTCLDFFQRFDTT